MKNILILGATSEVAIAVADLWAARSCNIMLAARNVNRLEPVKKDLTIRNGISVSLLEFDAEKTESHQGFYNQLQVKPDVVVCVFGYLGDHDLALSDWQECARILTINYLGAVSILNAVATDFEKNKRGVIVGVSSVAGDRGRQSNYLYGSAKSGFTAYLSGLRNRLFKSGIHVVTIKPGFINTRMLAGLSTPAMLTAQPKQVAAKILKAVNKKKNVVYVLPVWRWIMLIIKNIPEAIFKRLKL
ncbi:MAG TPA: SDR family oxidoreductase [Cyclobacteriaceae bacterium]|nr:SDR family oxidoreductase [Cyclobacteriaceae bacterium]